jgi:hypothetical protein
LTEEQVTMSPYNSSVIMPTVNNIVYQDVLVLNT